MGQTPDSLRLKTLPLSKMSFFSLIHHQLPLFFSVAFFSFSFFLIKITFVNDSSVLVAIILSRNISVLSHWLKIYLKVILTPYWCIYNIICACMMCIAQLIWTKWTYPLYQLCLTVFVFCFLVTVICLFRGPGSPLSHVS